MTLAPIDGGEVPEEAIKALEEHKPPETTEPGSEPSKETPEVKEGETQPTGQEESKVPFHEDPQVQLYIERQVAKRLGEGSKAYEDRLGRLEKQLEAKTEKGPITIGGWQPANDAEAKAARAIILQAKRELMEELSSVDRESKEAEAASDRDFSEFLGELRTTGVLKNDEDEQQFARLIVEYQLEDKSIAVKLWNTLKEKVSEAQQQGEEEGVKKSQEAKVGSSRKGSEPGSTGRSYQSRKLEEPNFDSIVEKEMTRMGY